MKDTFSILTERRIQEAIVRGDFKNLPGAGKPLKIEGLYFLPRKLRSAYIVLKSSGYLDQTNKRQNDFKPSKLADLNLSDGDIAISRQELSEKVFNHNVMMDCRRRR
ncbi:DnaJ family domain-containing protein [Desulfosporosinus shakirovi]|uniref:DnaJ family domain-containing protein n=1 Tax=Desulfosporosinus shakirovi TaxID=2885154 RepID=UPI001E49C820|nr:DUF1992 domain-containing protein [Desulfosporosinus sp. SRJS8]MCB8815170.1 DUF1992 domain-containing protein [Desulfosporosinus sp. SRJS8]